MGGSPCAANLLAFAAFVLSPAFAGLKFVVLRYLGLTPQALCLRLLRRLNLAPAPQAKTEFSCKARLAQLLGNCLQQITLLRPQEKVVAREHLEMK
jgi:hypothetical protein